MKSGVYSITNITDNRAYIGSSTKNVFGRILDHKRRLKKGIHYNPHLQRAWNKDGEENFIFDVVEFHEPEFCLSMEQYWMNLLNVCNSKYGYNVAPATYSSYGQRRTEKQKENIKKSLIGKRDGNKNSRYGTTWSEELREKISNKLKLRYRRIVQYSLEGRELNRFESMRQAERYLNIFKKSGNIRLCCLGKTKKAYGFIWKYEKDINNG